MACTQTLNGIMVDCEPSMGGLKVVYIANYSDVTDFEITDGQITAINMASGKTFIDYIRRCGSVAEIEIKRCKRI